MNKSKKIMGKAGQSAQQQQRHQQKKPIDFLYFYLLLLDMTFTAWSWTALHWIKSLSNQPTFLIPSFAATSFFFRSFHLHTQTHTHIYYAIFIFPSNKLFNKQTCIYRNEIGSLCCAWKYRNLRLNHTYTWCCVWSLLSYCSNESDGVMAVILTDFL